MSTCARAPAWGVAASILCASWDARAADEVARCVAASEKGQQLRDDTKLLEAREEFMQCARDACPSLVQKDCAQWLGEVTSSLPSVVLGAKNASGQDVLDARVMEDGRVIVSRLGGKAVFVNPGPHTFRFEQPDGATAEQKVVVREGERNRLVSATFGGAATPSASSPPPPAPEPAETTSNGPRTAAFVAGGLGVVALGIGAYFGVNAIRKRSESDKECPNGSCTATGVSLNDEAMTSAWVANVGVGLGLVGVGASVYLLIVSGRTTSAPARRAATAGVRVVPSITPRDAGLKIVGTFQ